MKRCIYCGKIVWKIFPNVVEEFHEKCRLNFENKKKDKQINKLIQHDYISIEKINSAWIEAFQRYGRHGGKKIVMSPSIYKNLCTCPDIKKDLSYANFTNQLYYSSLKVVVDNNIVGWYITNELRGDKIEAR